MSYDNTAKVSRQTKTRDDLNGGKCQILDAGATVLAEVTFDTPCGTVAGAGVLTFSGFPKVVTALAGGAAATARYVWPAGGVYRNPVAVGLPGSGAEVQIDNGSGTLVIAPGDQVTFAAPFTLQHAV